MTKNCGNCRFIVEGIDCLCRRYPRQPILKIDTFPRRFSTVWEFAVTTRNDICGEWKEEDGDAWRILTEEKETK